MAVMSTAAEIFTYQMPSGRYGRYKILGDAASLNATNPRTANFNLANVSRLYEQPAMALLVLLASQVKYIPVSAAISGRCVFVADCACSFARGAWFAARHTMLPSLRHITF